MREKDKREKEREGQNGCQREANSSVGDLRGNGTSWDGEGVDWGVTFLSQGCDANCEG